MVFEVDNTTEKLIQELQRSIEDTIAVLKDGQHDLRKLVEAAKAISEDAATADQANAISTQLSGLREEQRKAAAAASGQADAISAQLSGLREEREKTAAAASGQADAISAQLSGLLEEQGKAASARQVKDLGAAVDAARDQVLQGLAEMAGLKEEFTELGQSIQTDQRAALDTQKEALDQLARQLPAQLNKSEAEKLRSLQALSDQLTELSSGLTGRLDALASSSSGAAKTAAENQAALAAITAYLSLPGYKRFFKGMEAVRHETTP